MVDYEKLYHHLVARVDDALQFLVSDVNNGQHVIRAAELLRDALQDAEEEYLEATE